MTAIQNFSEPKTLKRIAALVVAAGVLTAGERLRDDRRHLHVDGPGP